MNRYTLLFVSFVCAALHAGDPRLAQGQPQQVPGITPEQLKAIYPTTQEIQAAYQEFPAVIEYLQQQSQDIKLVQDMLIKQHMPLIQEYETLQQHKEHIKQLEQENNGLRARADEHLQKLLGSSSKHHDDLVNTYLPLVLVAGALGSQAIVADCSQLQHSTILQAAGTMFFQEYIKKHPSLEQYSVSMSAFGLTGQVSLADAITGIFLNAKDDAQITVAKRLVDSIITVIDCDIEKNQLDSNASARFRAIEAQSHNAAQSLFPDGKNYLLECARIIASHQIKQSISLSQTTSRKLLGTDITLFHDAQLVDSIIAQGLSLVTEYMQGKSISATDCAQNVATDIGNELIYNTATQLLHAINKKTDSNDGLIECLISKDCQTHTSSQKCAKAMFNALSQAGKAQVLATSTALAAKTITNQIEQPVARIAANAAVDSTIELAHSYIAEYIASRQAPAARYIAKESLKEFSKNVFIEGTYVAACPLLHTLAKEYGQTVGIKETHVETFFPQDGRAKTVTHMLTALLCKYGTNLALSAVKQRVMSLGTYNAAKLLGVSEDAQPNEINKAFRTLALKHHSDHNPNNPLANEEFIQINLAKQNLLKNRNVGYRAITLIQNLIN